MNQIGVKLRKFRTDKGLTQEQVAQQAQIAPRSYQHYELGTRTPTLETTMQLATVLGIKLDDLDVRDSNTDSGETA